MEETCFCTITLARDFILVSCKGTAGRRGRQTIELHFTVGCNYP